MNENSVSNKIIDLKSESNLIRFSKLYVGSEQKVYRFLKEKLEINPGRSYTYKQINLLILVELGLHIPF